MIQFNLLPDIKKEYVRAKRTKRLIISGATLFSAAIIGVTVLLFSFVHVAQKQHIKHLTEDIKKKAESIQGTDNLNTMLTVQNQLSLLPGLHETKPETSRVFSYLTLVSPAAVVISTVDLDTTLNTITVTGEADNLATVNKLVNNIKAARHALPGEQDSTVTFSNVATELAGDNEGATFTILMSYDPVIFDNTQAVVMRLGDTPVPTLSGGQQ